MSDLKFISNHVPLDDVNGEIIGEMNKTELEIIGYLKSKGMYSFSTQAGRKPTGGKCNYPNTRRYNAAKNLHAEGLVNIESASWLETAYGYGINGADYVLTPTGLFWKTFGE